MLEFGNWWFNFRIISDCDKREGWTKVLKRQVVNEGVGIEVMEVNARKKTRKQVRESSLHLMHCTRIRIERGAWPVSGYWRYFNLHFLVQGIGKGTEELCGRWVWTLTLKRGKESIREVNDMVAFANLEKDLKRYRAGNNSTALVFFFN